MTWSVTAHGALCPGLEVNNTAKGIQRLEAPERRRESKEGTARRTGTEGGITGLEPGGIGIRERQSPEELQMDGCCLMVDSSGGLGLGHFPELSSLVAAPRPHLESLQVMLELLRDLTPLAQQAEKVQHVKRAP